MDDRCSLQVTGYNWSIRGNGETLTTAHGLWRSVKSAGRYARFEAAAVNAIPLNMIAQVLSTLMCGLMICPSGKLLPKLSFPPTHRFLDLVVECYDRMCT